MPWTRIDITIATCDADGCNEKLLLKTEEFSEARIREVLVEQKWAFLLWTTSNRCFCPDHHLK